MNTDSAVSSLSLLGKTSAALLLVIVVILLAAWLVRRCNLQRRFSQTHLQVISSIAVGQKERIVIVDAEGSRLVLGVTAGSINLLQEKAAPEQPPTEQAVQENSFAGRFTQALQQRLENRRK